MTNLKPLAFNLYLKSHENKKPSPKNCAGAHAAGVGAHCRMQYCS